MNAQLEVVNSGKKQKAALLSFKLFLLAGSDFVDFSKPKAREYQCHVHDLD